MAWGGDGLTGFLLRGLVAAVCLLPPTLAMGATLPAVSRWVEATPEGMSRLGLFYAGNIAGAVFGSLFTGFYLLRVYDMRIATYVAAGLNILVAALAVRYDASRTPVDSSPPSSQSLPSSSSFDRSTVYFAIALSGVRERAHAEAVAAKVVDAARAPFTVGALTLRVGASVGVSFQPGACGGWQALMEHADDMLYRAKAAGRGTYA